MISDSRLVGTVLFAFLLTTSVTVTQDTSVAVAQSRGVRIPATGTIDYSSFLPTQRSELRGVLVKYIAATAHDDDLICRTLSSYGINAVYLEVNPFKWTGYALNAFQSMINACRKYGLDFHVLVVYMGYEATYAIGSELLYSYGLSGSDPDWRAVDVDGNYVNTICLQRTSTRARLKQVIQTMITTFPDIVEINHDYIRYATRDDLGIGDINFKLCYCDECKDAFDMWLADNGKAPVSDATFRTDCAWNSATTHGSRWYDFVQWRVTVINNIVRDVRQWALAKNRKLKFSADIWTPYVGWQPDTYKYEMGQDPAYWISQGWLDTVNPMNYIDEATNGITWAQNRAKLQLDNELSLYTGGNATNPEGMGAIPLVPFIDQGGVEGGLGGPVSVAFWTWFIDYMRQRGTNGFIIWRYVGPGFDQTGNDLVPYLAAIRNLTAKGAYPVFEQTQPLTIGSRITWKTSLPTTARVEYSRTPIFIAIQKNGSHIPYVDIDYAPGTIVAEATPTTDHSIVVPVSQPFYYRILDLDANVELASTFFTNVGGTKEA